MVCSMASKNYPEILAIAFTSSTLYTDFQFGPFECHLLGVCSLGASNNLAL